MAQLADLRALANWLLARPGTRQVEPVVPARLRAALPALLQNGLLAHSRELFSMPEGYYPLESIFLLLAFMALSLPWRLSSIFSASMEAFWVGVRIRS